jgi:hypothetical protein
MTRRNDFGQRREDLYLERPTRLEDPELVARHLVPDPAKPVVV